MIFPENRFQLLRIMLSALPFLLARAQIIFGGAQPRALRRPERIEVLLSGHLDAAVGAHFDEIKPLGVPIHPVLAFELGRYALHRTFDSKRRATTNAEERVFLLDDTA